ncbi:hypothetical protein D3C78_462680 [compost metagenome]
MQPRCHIRHPRKPRHAHRPPCLQHIAPAQRRTAHAAYMPLKVPLGHELGHHALGSHLGMPHCQRPALAESLHQPRRQYQIAKAQRWESDLAKGTDVQHPPLPVQSRQRRQRCSVVTVLAVIVIFDDPAILALGPGQQRQAPGQAHGHPRRVLVRRGDVNQATVASEGKPGAVEALFIYRHPPHPPARYCKRMPGGTIPGVFHSHLIPGLQQQLCTKTYCLLRTTGDHNLSSRARHPPRPT